MRVNKHRSKFLLSIPHTCYLIAASPRSGSQLLGSLLTATGLAGFPDEHFNPWHMGDATNFFPDDLLYTPEHIQRLIEKFTTPNGVFGTKAHFLQVTNFVGLDHLESLYPTPLKYISLTRRDVVRQGISLARAAQTNAYNSDMQPTREPVYNFHQISQCTREVRIQTKGWETYFHQRGIEPFRVVYEDFLTDQERIIRGVLEYLGVAVPEDFRIPETHLKKQADSLSDQWVEKFNRGDQE
jgi:LPS sulfotransferase NodH